MSQIASWSSTCESGGCGNGSTVASLLIPNSTNNGSAFNGGIGLATAPANPPGGGNIVAIDGDPTYTATISQVIAGLTVGTNYTLSFYQAAGEQSGFDTATTEHWSVTFGGGAAQSSTVMNNTPAGFVAWAQQNMTFTATAVSETLTFAALGTPPTGAPPVVLLSDVSLTAVPEPAGVAVLGFGLALLFVARRNRASGGDGTLAG